MLLKILCCVKKADFWFHINSLQLYIDDVDMKETLIVALVVAQISLTFF